MPDKTNKIRVRKLTVCKYLYEFILLSINCNLFVRVVILYESFFPSHFNA